MKTKFNLDDDLPLNKMIEIPSMLEMFFMGIKNIIHKFFQMNVNISYQ